jgi:hypothetical protein
MKEHHLHPCKECPWRCDSPQGYLGGWTPEQYADAVNEGVIPACHMKDYGPLDPRTAFCAGAASALAYSATSPRETEAGQAGARDFVAKVGPHKYTFSNAGRFYKYHAGKACTPRLMRMFT